MRAAELRINGIVQGVGFRPFLKKNADELGLCGFAENTPSGVLVRFCGEDEKAEEFIFRIKNTPPVLSRVKSVEVIPIPAFSAAAFVISPSVPGAADTFVSPDMGICENCKKDIENSTDRRFGYAFTNCTDCGPRFSIIEAVPYDRAKTTMKSFEMCDNCRKEYEDTGNRRFHAQPVACPDCGPSVRYINSRGKKENEPFEAFKREIKRGGIVAVKGLGGFHLACDALNEKAVSVLRERKLRFQKPFAVMAGDIETVKKYCFVSGEEERLLTSPEKPIVILKKRPGTPLAPGVAPCNKTLGVMLAYTPLHCIIMREFELLVMTSGNVSDLPMAFDDRAGEKLLGTLADGLLTHNREIYRRVDDSVCRVINGGARFIRRARGFAPEPVEIPNPCGEQVLAFGAQQKNTFCIVKGNSAFPSSHIGDLDDEKTAGSYENEIASFLSLFGCEPGIAVRDLHPDYYSSRRAGETGGGVISVQHHRAHFASVLAENLVCTDNILGFVFDGTGLGDDGTVWGGEVFLGGIEKSQRTAHLLCFPLPGGEAAIKEPWRTAAALISAACPEAGFTVLGEKAKLCESVLAAAKANINSPLTSSMGRLFDGIAAIAGLCSAAAYEGQGAEKLEHAVDEAAEGSYEFEISEKDGMFIFDWRGLVKSAVDDIMSGTAAGTVAARFHRAVTRLITDFTDLMKNRFDIGGAALSGGCFQNEYLSRTAESELESRGVQVYVNRLVPCNDGGISLGQAAVACAVSVHKTEG